MRDFFDLLPRGLYECLCVPNQWAWRKPGDDRSSWLVSGIHPANLLCYLVVEKRNGDRQTNQKAKLQNMDETHHHTDSYVPLTIADPASKRCYFGRQESRHNWCLTMKGKNTYKLDNQSSHTLSLLDLSSWIIIFMCFFYHPQHDISQRKHNTHTQKKKNHEVTSPLVRFSFFSPGLQSTSVS